MRQIILTLLLLFTLIADSQQVTYTKTDENFVNPERGFYVYTKTGDTGYTLLTKAQVDGYTIKVYNLQGRKVSSDFTRLKSGTYIVK